MASLCTGLPRNRVCEPPALSSEAEKGAEDDLARLGLRASILDVGRLSVQLDSCNTLCLRFRPVYIEPDEKARPGVGGCIDVQPIVAASVGVRAFSWNAADKSHVLVAMSLCHGLISVCRSQDQQQETQSWAKLKFEGLQELLKNKWCTYGDYWHDNFGQEETRRSVREALNLSASEVAMKPGMLTARAQVS
ncbi:hypothetical protein B0T26DRAFT_680898 [Lasiosphaeria miniovina]|uniref:Uncharacterized protein n=1 Tax=Lasiosphaeria miniovina TaxID=1954250 RepID=A0AA39ZT16_9PEZI|nr:uncharacterized protein B0T26DRAFT_680898 [Lasiosphaeria miniovina]KAK0703171.1 hypothetical protein B0T26DRAFT_680898 [Lasiosphaeria miniovina]